MNIIPTQQEVAVLRDLGNTLVRSGFLPSTVKSSEQAIAIMLKGKELGIPPMQAFAQISIVQGKPVISSELMMALVYKHVPGAVIDVVENSDKACVISAQRPGGKPATFSFSIEDAKKADLLSKDNWRKYPQAMLRARCIASMARFLFPDALMGASYTEEELEPAPAAKPKEVEVPSDVVQPQQVLPPPAVAKEAPSPKSRMIYDLSTKLGWTAIEVSELLQTKYGAAKVDELVEEAFQDLLLTLEKDKTK